MHIAFKFHYIHENGLFTRLLKRIEQLSNVPLSLYEKDQYFIIVAHGDQTALENLAEQISTLVPRSLFLQDSNVEAIEPEALDKSMFSPLTQYTTSFKVPYCPECQENVVKTFDPFTPCSVCGFTEISLSLDDLVNYTGIQTKTIHEFFQALADNIIDTGKITLPTYNGIRTFSLLNHKDEDEGILICDPTHISEKFLITQGELDALMMVEKPTVRLKAKLKLRAEYELHRPFYPLFFADDKVTLALTTALKQKGIDAVYSNHIPSLRVASALEQHLIIQNGRDMLPYRIDLALSHPAFCAYNGFQAYGDPNGSELTTKLEFTPQSVIHYLSNEEKSTVTNAIRFEPAHAAMRSIVLENSLDNRSLCGIHLSREHTSHIFSFSEKIGYTSMVLFDDEGIRQPKQMLLAIEAMDDGGRRLVNNFKDKFPELYKKIEQIEFTKYNDLSDFTKIWSFAAVFIGLYDGDDALRSSEMLEAAAIEFSGKSGPRIDYKVISTEKGYQLDMKLAIRSAMSFKLAGLDDYLLSFGFIDSLADFIAEQAENADANIDIDGVTISGSLFENRQLLMRTYNGLSVNYPLYRNRRLSIDNANVALGAITLGIE
jgi:hypothetical protein